LLLQWGQLYCKPWTGLGQAVAQWLPPQLKH
jgi:hypothetical protein